MALAPTVAVVWETGTPAGVAERLEGLGIRVMSIPTRNLDDIAAGVEKLGELAGTEVIAEVAAQEFRARIASLREHYRDRPRIRVFVQIDGAPLFTVGGPHLITQIVELCGGANVFAESNAQALPVDLESVLVRAPDVILSVDDADPVPFWARFTALAAVARDNVYRAPADLLARPSPRIAEGAAKRLRTPRRGAWQAGWQGAGLAARRRAAALVLPQHFAAALMACKHAREHEQQVGEPVQVLERLGCDRRHARKRPGAPLRAPADGTREVAGGSRRAAARQDELLERRQPFIERVERLFERKHLCGIDRAVAGNAKLAAEVEELVLHRRQELAHVRRQSRHRKDHADCAVRLVDATIGLDARIVLRYAAAVAEAGRAVIARARIDLREPVSHGIPSAELVA